MKKVCINLTFFLFSNLFSSNFYTFIDNFNNTKGFILSLDEYLACLIALKLLVLLSMTKYVCFLIFLFTLSKTCRAELSYNHSLAVRARCNYGRKLHSPKVPFCLSSILFFKFWRTSNNFYYLSKRRKLNT